MKTRKQRKVRNLEVLEMILTRKGGVHKDRREKRLSNPNKRDW
jgi:hypothetical protein